MNLLLNTSYKYTKLYSATYKGIEINYYKYNDRDMLQKLFEEAYPNKKTTIDDYTLTKTEFLNYIDMVFTNDLEQFIPSYLENGLKELNIVDILSTKMKNSFSGAIYDVAQIIEIPNFIISFENNIGYLHDTNNIKDDINNTNNNAILNSLKTIYHEIGHGANFYYDNIYNQAYPNIKNGYELYRGIGKAIDDYKKYGNYYHHPYEIAAEDFLEIMNLIQGSQKYFTRSGDKMLRGVFGDESRPHYYDENQNNKMYNWYNALEHYIKTNDKEVLPVIDLEYVYDPFSSYSKDMLTNLFKQKVSSLSSMEKGLTESIIINFNRVVYDSGVKNDNISVIVAEKIEGKIVLYEQTTEEYIKNLRNSKNINDLLKSVIGFRDASGIIHRNIHHYNKYNFFMENKRLNEKFLKFEYSKTDVDRFNRMFEKFNRDLLNTTDFYALNKVEKENLKYDIEQPEEISYEQALNICSKLGLITGSDGNVTKEYGKTYVTRQQVAYMLLRLLSKKTTARKYDTGSNFTDITPKTLGWEEGRNMISYIHDNPNLGFNGYPDGTFNPGGKISGQAALKVMLTIVGYEYDVDFSWSEVQGFSNQKNINSLNGKISSNIKMQDFATLIVEALSINMNDEFYTLADTLGIDLDSLSE